MTTILINMLINGVTPIPQTAMETGSTCVVPSFDFSSFPPLINSLEGELTVFNKKQIFQAKDVRCYDGILGSLMN